MQVVVADRKARGAPNGYVCLSRCTEWDPTTGGRRTVALSPQHTAGIVGSIEQEEGYSVGLKFYYTGRQALEHNPFRNVSRPYAIVGLLAERWVSTRAGLARLFVNLENVGNVRQTRYDPLVLPQQGQGGRWTTDVWTELSGFTTNAGRFCAEAPYPAPRTRATFRHRQLALDDVRTT